MNDSTGWHVSCEVCGWDAHADDDATPSASNKAIDHFVETGHTPIIGYDPRCGRPDDGSESAGVTGGIGRSL